MGADLARRMAERTDESPGMLLLLAMLGGAYVALGTTFMVALREQGMPPVVCGVGFSMGMLAVVATGAELLTDDALMMAAWVSDEVGMFEVLSTWGVVLMGNLLGAVMVGEFVATTGCVSAATMAEYKCSVPNVQLFMSGAFCNVLACMAAYMAGGARSVQGKMLAVLLPVTAFVTCGFEHGIADMALLPMGAVCDAQVSLADCVRVVALSLAGNMIGGAVYAVVMNAAHGRH